METVARGRFYDTHLPYVKLSGTPLEIGLGHGTFAKAQIVKAIEVYSTLYKESKNVSWDEARRRAAKYLPLLEKHPDILDELRGIAQGSGTDLLDIVALNVRSEITMVDISDGCTSLAQVESSTGDVYVGQNWDWIPEVDATTLWIELEQARKPKLLFLAEAGIIGKYGFNSEGLAIMLNAISSNEVSYDKLPIHFTLRKCLEQESVEKTVDYLESNGCASCANLLMGDVNSYCSVEVSPRGIAIIKPDDDTGVVSHTNHLLDETLSKEFPCDTPILSSFARYDRIKELNVGSEGGFKSFRSRLGDIANAPKSICKYPEEDVTGLAKCCTLYTIIVNTKTKEANFSHGRPHDNPKEYRVSFS